MLTFHFRLPSEDHPKKRANSFFVNRGGEIYIETENGYFPCIGWKDLLLVVVHQWIGNALMMLDQKDEVQNIANYFMDGPYIFTLQKMRKDYIMIHFAKQIGEADEKEEMPPLTIKCADYYNALACLGENIINDPNFHWLGKEQERTHFQQSVVNLRARL